MRNSKRSHEGYLLIDHRHSPGLTPGEVPDMGLDAPIVGAGQLYESATITCSHCQVTVVLNPLRTRERGYCTKCDHYVCDNPGCNRECLPMVRVLDILQELALKRGG